jgi:ankyrin repeat protein
MGATVVFFVLIIIIICSIIAIAGISFSVFQIIKHIKAKEKFKKYVITGIISCIPLFSIFIIFFVFIFGMVSDIQNDKGPLIIAVERNDIKKVRKLVEGGYDVNHRSTRDYQNMTPLYMAVKKKNTEIVEILINNKADVNKSASSFLYPPISAAIENDDYEMTKLLLEHGALVKSEYFSALYQALTYSPRPEIITLLIKNGADVNARHYESEPLLHALIKKSKVPFDFFGYNIKQQKAIYDNLKVMIENGVKINARDDKGKTVLDYADENNYTDIADFIKSHGGKYGNQLSNP